MTSEERREARYHRRKSKRQANRLKRSKEVGTLQDVFNYHDMMNTLQNLILSNEDETLNREVKAYQEKLTSKTNEIPLWERQWLTIEEASEYSGIARRKLRELSNTSGCPFAIWMGNKIHIIREKLDRYTETHNRI